VFADVVVACRTIAPHICTATAHQRSVPSPLSGGSLLCHSKPCPFSFLTALMMSYIHACLSSFSPVGLCRWTRGRWCRRLQWRTGCSTTQSASLRHTLSTRKVFYKLCCTLGPASVLWPCQAELQSPCHVFMLSIVACCTHDKKQWI
jgi:hypothetical protein